ncbi:hypothetical protein BJP40_06460 [Streptomyces sp. CC53]|uniref:hypothetical protein n=1 Tax=Streptomyces sp. CC53 TaxID=1906740 RepID=UPI0008DD3F78|nr:hypothetical protein [Streptomyces sp. CC53]OII61165.1 hypothetical protein BJP40_06460 [Streptomyces sp. CC53]
MSQPDEPARPEPTVEPQPPADVGTEWRYCSSCARLEPADEAGVLLPHLASKSTSSTLMCQGGGEKGPLLPPKPDMAAVHKCPYMNGCNICKPKDDDDDYDD